MVSLFLLLGCNLSYIVDLFAALHELASASARTLLKLASAVRALLKPYGDTLMLFEFSVSAQIISLPDLLGTKPKARSGQIQFAFRDHLSGMWQGRQVRMPNIFGAVKADFVAYNKLTTGLRHDVRIFARISEFPRFHETKQAQNEVERFFSTTWPDLFSNTFATVGEF